MLAVLARHRIVSGVARRHHGAITFESDYHDEEKSASLEIVGAGGEELRAGEEEDPRSRRCSGRRNQKRRCEAHRGLWGSCESAPFIH